jgi:hypothetical protein
MIELENRWTNLNEILYGRYAIRVCPKNRIFKFSTISDTNMAGKQTCEVGSTLAPLAVGPYSDV